MRQETPMPMTPTEALEEHDLASPPREMPRGGRASGSRSDDDPEQEYSDDEHELRPFRGVTTQGANDLLCAIFPVCLLCRGEIRVKGCRHPLHTARTTPVSSPSGSPPYRPGSS